MHMKKYLIILCLVFSLSSVSAQQLKINEAIEYLNSLSDKYLKNKKKDWAGYKFYYYDNTDYIMMVLTASSLSTGNEDHSEGINAPLNEYAETRVVNSPLDTFMLSLATYKTLPRKIEKNNIYCWETLSFRDAKNIALRQTPQESGIGFDIQVPCHLSSLLKIYDDGLKYITSLISEKESSMTIYNPFSRKDTFNQELIIPLTLDGNIFTMRASINKVPLEFVFDSGASDCSLNENTFERLVKISGASIFKKISDGLYQMADGSIKNQSRYIVSSMSIGNQVIKNIRVAITPNGSPNILGHSFIANFSNWSIDQKRQILVLKW